jgi:two-component system, response regulator
MEAEDKIVEILFVEDNMNDAEMALRSLKKNNMANHVYHVQDGEEALNFLFSEQIKSFPKLILLDLKMPKVDGIEVLRRIKSDAKRRIIPVVVMTSSKEECDIVESYELGVNAYIVKPVDFEKFSKAIAEVGSFWLGLNQPLQKTRLHEG